MTALPTVDGFLALVKAKKLAHNAKDVKGCVERATAGTREGAVMEPKLDGWRILAWIGDDGVRLFARSGMEQTGKLPFIEAELAAQFPAGTWLDCEAVVMSAGEDGTINDWGSVQSIMGTPDVARAARMSEPVSLFVFDMMGLAGTDYRALSFAARRDALETLFADEGFSRVLLTPQVAATEDSYEALVASGYEGGMVKHLHARYASGKRGHGLFKLKAAFDLDAVVMDYKPGKNSFTGYVGAIIFGQYDAEGRLHEVGRCSGMTWAERVEITRNASAYLGRVVTVKHMGFMGDGYRHPQFQCFRDDKAADECVIENGALAVVA